MRRFFLIAIIAIVLPLSLDSQPSTSTTVATVTMCELFEKPEKYAGTMVRVRAGVIGRDFSELWLDSIGCKPEQGYIRVLGVLPDDVEPRPDFGITVDDSFVQFRSSLSTKRLLATFVGSFQPVFVWRDRERIRVGKGTGYGKKHEYDARLIIRSISDVTVLPVFAH